MTAPKRPTLFDRAEIERAGPREKVRIPAVCRIGERTVEDALVTDIGPAGCRVRAIMIGVTKFERVVLEFAGEAPVEGRLKWIRQASFGVEFETPLDDELRARLALLVAPSNVVPLRRPRFG